MRKTSVVWLPSREELAEVVKSSSMFTEILGYCGLKHIGSNCKTLKRRLDVENIDYSHIPQGRYASRGRCNFRADPTPYEEVLVKDSKFARSTARRAVLRENLIGYKCAICGMGPKWHDKPIVLRLDHINGVRDDHRLENLRFLCPNCDSQTETFGGRNTKQYFPDAPDRTCSQCGGYVPRKAKTGVCCKCTYSNKSKMPSKGELRKMIWDEPTVQVARRFGVSDKAVQKWCKKYDIPKPGPGYWAKKRANKQLAP